MRKKKIALFAVGGLTLSVVAFCRFAYYDFSRNFRISFTPEQLNNAEIALKGALGEAIFSGAPAQSAKPEGKVVWPVGNTGEGLIEAYRKDPQKFKRYAEMLETAAKAKQVGDAVLGQSPAYLPLTSEPLPIEASLKIDAWGSPFCIIPIHPRVAIVSGGPSRLSCRALPLTAEQIAKSDRNVYAGPSDVVVVITTRESLGKSVLPSRENADVRSK